MTTVQIPPENDCGDIYYKLGDAVKSVEFWKKADAMISNGENTETTLPTEKEKQRLKKKIALKKYVEE